MNPQHSSRIETFKLYLTGPRPATVENLSTCPSSFVV